MKISTKWFFNRGNCKKQMSYMVATCATAVSVTSLVKKIKAHWDIFDQPDKFSGLPIKRS